MTALLLIFLITLYFIDNYKDEILDSFKKDFYFTSYIVALIFLNIILFFALDFSSGVWDITTLLMPSEIRAGGLKVFFLLIVSGLNLLFVIENVKKGGFVFYLIKEDLRRIYNIQLNYTPKLKYKWVILIAINLFLMPIFFANVSILLDSDLVEIVQIPVYFFNDFKIILSSLMLALYLQCFFILSLMICLIFLILKSFCLFLREVVFQKKFYFIRLIKIKSKDNALYSLFMFLVLFNIWAFGYTYRITTGLLAGNKSVDVFVSINYVNKPTRCKNPQISSEDKVLFVDFNHLSVATKVNDSYKFRIEKCDLSIK